MLGATLVQQAAIIMNFINKTHKVSFLVKIGSVFASGNWILIKLELNGVLCIPLSIAGVEKFSSVPRCNLMEVSFAYKLRNSLNDCRWLHWESSQVGGRIVRWSRLDRSASRLYEHCSRSDRDFLAPVLPASRALGITIGLPRASRVAVYFRRRRPLILIISPILDVPRTETLYLNHLQKSLASLSSRRTINYPVVNGCESLDGAMATKRTSVFIGRAGPKWPPIDRVLQDLRTLAGLSMSRFG